MSVAHFGVNLLIAVIDDGEFAGYLSNGETL